MASTQTWDEWNGAGKTRTQTRAEANWKNVDDSSTAYSSSPITAGNNSFDKQQAILFGGTFNSLSSLSYKVSSNTPGTGCSVVAKVIATTYTQPATTALGGATAASTTGTSANFVASITDPYAAGVATLSAAGYGQVYNTQLQTTGAAGPGDITSVTITATWTES